MMNNPGSMIQGESRIAFRFWASRISSPQLAIGGLMTLTSWEVLQTVLRHMLGRDGAGQPELAGVWLWLVSIGLVINIFVTIYEERRGRELGSMILLADAAHTRIDVLITFLSIVSLTLTHRVPWIDEALSLVVIWFILRTGWGIIRDNALLLTDARQMEPEPIRRLVEAIEGVDNCHAVRSHGMPDQIHLDLHIVVSPELNAVQTEAIETQVRQTLQVSFPDIAEVSIHHQTTIPRADTA